MLVPSYHAAVHAKLVHWTVQLRQRHSALVRVKALEPNAALMEVFQAATASRGRPCDGDGVLAVKAAHEKIETYASGSFKPEFIVAVTNHDARTVGTSLKRSKEDALRAAGLLFTNVPKADELQGHNQKTKSFHYPARRTASGHAKDVAQWRIEQRAKQLGPRRSLFWDEALCSVPTIAHY